MRLVLAASPDERYETKGVFYCCSGDVSAQVHP